MAGGPDRDHAIIILFPVFTAVGSRGAGSGLRRRSTRDVEQASHSADISGSLQARLRADLPPSLVKLGRLLLSDPDIRGDIGERRGLVGRCLGPFLLIRLKCVQAANLAVGE